MNTFKAKFCERHRCAPGSFARKVLWRTLPLPLLPLAFIWTLVCRSAFAPDLRLIEFCGEARDLRTVGDEIAGYFSEAFCWSFGRRRLHFRVSTYKLKRLARKNLETDGASGRETLSDFLATI